MKRLLTVLLIFIVLSGCSVPMIGGNGCPPNTIIEWKHIVQINDIKYAALDPGTFQVKEGDKGQIVGEVSYTMADKACSNHQMKNGHAAFLGVGTEIYEHTGYKTSYRVIADDIVYEVEENDQAKTIGDLYDIEGKVVGMSLRSSYDGSHVMDLEEEHWGGFVDEFLALDYLGFDEVYEKIENDDRTFLHIHLKDDSAVGIVYWTEGNVINTGAIGNEEMMRIIELYD